MAHCDALETVPGEVRVLHLDQTRKGVETKVMEPRVTALEEAAGELGRDEVHVGLAQNSERLTKLSASIRPGACRPFTLEELCRAYWQMDARGFRSLVNHEYTLYRVLVESFEQENANRAKA